MFLRRSKIHPIKRLYDFFWPRSGWRRAGRYVFHRMARIPGTPYSIAGGFACGAAISFSPFVGLHFVLSAILAFIIRANILASAIGTAVGNPWTFPFIWVWIFNLGKWLGAGENTDNIEQLDFPRFFGSIMSALVDFDLSYLLQTAWPVFWPMFVGSIPTAVFIWFVFYLPLKPMVAGYQKRRRQRMHGETGETK